MPRPASSLSFSVTSSRNPSRHASPSASPIPSRQQRQQQQQEQPGSRYKSVVLDVPHQRARTGTRTASNTNSHSRGVTFANENDVSFLKQDEIDRLARDIASERSSLEALAEKVEEKRAAISVSGGFVSSFNLPLLTYSYFSFRPTRPNVSRKPCSKRQKLKTCLPKNFPKSMIFSNRSIPTQPLRQTATSVALHPHNTLLLWKSPFGVKLNHFVNRNRNNNKRLFDKWWVL